MNKLTQLAAAAAFAFSGAAFAATTADVVVVIDESGSMSGEHAWIATAIQDLEADLTANGVTNNRYALVGYGSGQSNPTDPTGIDNVARGNDTWMDATNFVTASGLLTTPGGTEDGYQGISYFFSNYTTRAEAAVNVILVTDEDRDVVSADTYNSILTQLTGVNALLNVVVEATLEDDNLTSALGIDSLGNAYIADGSGGYTEGTGGNVVSAFGTTEADYIDLAFDTGGAAWDLTQLRNGGNDAASFSEAFTAIKTEEIQQQQPAPIVGSALLMGLGLAGFGFARRRA